jgi:ABC-type branched-subunit amino acid transport system ATPase component
VLAQGSLLADGIPTEVMARPDVITAYLGRHHA